MAKNQYDELDESHFSNPRTIRGIVQQFAEYEESFKKGNRHSLFATVCLCCQYQAVIPPWAADAIMQGATDIRSGECKDYNDLFGSDLPKQKKRQQETMIQNNSGPVLAMLMNHRHAGGSLNVEDAFAFVSEESGLPRRIVQEVYKRHQKAVKSLPQRNPENDPHGTSIVALPILRRYGRKNLL